jgi:hypothetical protein
MATVGFRHPLLTLIAYYLNCPPEDVRAVQHREVQQIIEGILQQPLLFNAAMWGEAFIKARETFLLGKGYNFPPVGNQTTEQVCGLLEALANKWVTETPPQRGVYDHFKGGVYFVTDTSLWVSGETPEEAVEYLSATNGRRFTRLAWQWSEVVVWPDGKYRSRFVYRGPNLTDAPPSFKVTPVEG